MGDVVHINAPASVRARIVKRCTACRRRRRHVVSLYQWYGPMVTCCACGFSVNDGNVERLSKKRRAERARWAREWWPRAMRWDDAVRAVSADLM